MRRLIALAFVLGLVSVARGGWLPFPSHWLLERRVENALVTDNAPVAESKRQREGHRLFVHNWRMHGKVNRTGDGLGPMFNAVSCAHCHRQGGIGGSGDADANVDLLSLASPNLRRRRPMVGPLSNAASKVHAGFIGQGSVVLHRYGYDNDSTTETSYRPFRRKLLGLDSKAPLSLARPYRRFRGVWLHYSQRNTPALFGVGLIDKVPDRLLIETARMQRKRHDGITGRVPQTADGAVGRFGWRGQTATLHDFVKGACANELGLEVPGVSQPANPLPGRSRTLVFDPQNRRFDLTEQQCQSITDYITALPAPGVVRKQSLQQSLDVEKGEKLFGVLGCAACHIKDMGPAKGVYSDLLLHDMGPKLSDELAATPEITDKTMSRGTSLSGAGYFGSTAPQLARITTNIQQEWRTPPLWGLRNSAPYMHDGRALDYHEAVLWHGGEATVARRRYLRLRTADKRLLWDFLDSLGKVDAAEPLPQSCGHPASRQGAMGGANRRGSFRIHGPII